MFIIGEAAWKIGKSDEAIAQQITNHQRICSFRHIVTHDYHRLDIETMWDIIENHLPTLLDDVTKLLH